MDSIGPTEAKVTPIITGRRIPTPGNPMLCTIVARPQANRSALIRKETCSWREVHCTPNDQGNRDCARIHDEDMLNRQRHQSGDRKAFVYRMDAEGHSVTFSATL